MITGGAGFIGSHLAEALLAVGHDVTVIDDLSTGRFDNIAHLAARYPPAGPGPCFRFAIDTIAHETVLDRLAADCQLVFHLAAAVGVRLVVEQPVRTIETNVAGTQAVLEAALRYRAQVIVASTSEVYGKGNSIPFAEDDDVVLGPTRHSRWAYAASKMVDEFLALAYHGERGLPVVVARLFNTIGPRQTGRYGMVVPRFVSQALAGQPLTVYGDGHQTRCFADVRDVVRGLIALAGSPTATGQVFNLGSTREISIADLARLVIQVTGSRSEIAYVPYDQAYEAGFEDLRRRVPDVSRARHVIGWSAHIPLEDTLGAIVDHLKPPSPEANP